MKQSLSFIVGAIQIFADYANAFGDTKVLVSESHQWSLNSDQLDWKVS